ncbi:MAG: hypothetical protein JW395_0250 [Nitrospira sp.]|nr:hypothetical protein [Nitrospira sp.]
MNAIPSKNLREIVDPDEFRRPRPKVIVQGIAELRSKTQLVLHERATPHHHCVAFDGVREQHLSADIGVRYRQLLPQCAQATVGAVGDEV